MFHMVALVGALIVGLSTNARDAAKDVPSLLAYELNNMSVGCAVGAVSGAMIGTMPVVSVWGGVAVPYTVPQAAAYGCVAGMAITGAGTMMIVEAYLLMH